MVYEDDADGRAAHQYVTLAACEIPHQDPTETVEQAHRHEREFKIIDGYAYVGAHAQKEMQGSGFIITDRLRHSYITTAVLRRSGCHPDTELQQTPEQLQRSRAAVSALEEQLDLDEWLKGDDAPHSTLCGGCEVSINSTKVLPVFERKAVLDNLQFVVIPGNELRVILGHDIVAAVDQHLEADESPMQSHVPQGVQGELRAALDHMAQGVENNTEFGRRADVLHMLREKYVATWRSKYDLQQAAELPPMVIKLRPGAKPPPRTRRRYRWTPDQRKCLAAMLKRLVDVGVISHTDSEWCCPIVLVVKPDGSWRLCVDPTYINKVTVPMIWEMPMVRGIIQEKLRGMKWMCQFDFMSMFWQIPLDEASRKLFSFYTGEFGSFQFNRVAMGALNSSFYTQKMVTHMFRNVQRRDGRPLLGNGLMIQTDDVLLHAVDEDEMVEILDLFLQTVACHKLAINPRKCALLIKETVYCGLLVTREGISVDPARTKGLREMPPPKNVGDVWQFNAAAGWIRDEIPLFSEASSVLSAFRTKALQGRKRKNMNAAKRIKLRDAGWGADEQQAWDTIQDAMLHTVTSSFRDKRKQACLFTDASTEGWAYVITQCAPGELEKPWQDQRHELLAVNSGRFRNSQVRWAMPCSHARKLTPSVTPSKSTGSS